VLNENGALWAETDVDGWIGPETIKFLGACSQLRKSAFLALYEATRLAYHVKNSKYNPKLEKYINGWVRRVMANRQG
jgi:lysozyme family protein